MITARIKKNIFLWLILLAVFFLKKNIPVMAAGSCTSTINPTVVQTSTNSNFVFSITNTGSNPILYIKIISPSSNFLIQGGSLSGWEGGGNGQSIEFYGGSFVAGSTLEIPISVLSGSNETSAENWTIEINEILSSSGTSNCSGSLGTAISGVKDITAPQIIGDIIISDISDTSATFKWTTDENSNSTVNYGLVDGEYDQTKTDATMTTSHSITLTGLTANTKYYFEVVSADASGNSVRDSQNEFTTAMTGVNIGTTVVVTVNTTTTNTVTTVNTVTAPTSIPTPTPRPLVDTVKPVVNISTDFSKPFTDAPTMVGKATDSGDINVGVVSVDYSLDGGKNWLPVDVVDGVGKKSTNFEFTPVGLDDGNYLIKVRAKDSTGNVGNSKNYVMVIDRLPPQVGGSLFALGPMILKPDSNGYIHGIAGMEIKVILSAVGGPTNIDLFLGSEKFSLSKNEESGLWSGLIRIDKSGNFQLTNKSVDGAKNETERKMSTIVALNPGKIIDENNKVISKAKIKIYTFEKVQNDYVLWEAEPYRQSNPQETDENGEYRLILPAGKYFLEIEANGKRKIRSEIFEIETATPINQNFSLEKALFWGNWWAKTIPINLMSSQEVNSQEVKSDLVGKMFPDFDLSTQDNEFSSTSILGRPTVITFVSSWEPQSSDQLLELDQFKSENDGVNVVVVVTQESVSKVDIFKRVGEYKIPTIADPDGILVVPLNLESLPTHIFLDRKGMIKDMYVGFLDESNLLKRILN